MEVMFLLPIQGMVEMFGYINGAILKIILTQKISPGGFGGESIEKTLDNGFIISTGGGTVLKTDSHLSY